MPQSITFSAIEIEQPIGKFYVGVIDHHDLTEIAFADVRQMTDQKDQYLGIQRRVNPVRVEEIRAYTKTKDATFPTSIILAVEGKCAAWDGDNLKMTLAEYISETPDNPEDPNVPYDKIAKILDGQHRIEGLIGNTGPTFQLNVAVFVDTDIAEQANIFATVNLAQTKVNKSLVYDLFDFARARSPQKSAHNIAVALNTVGKSPLCRRIKRLGVSTQGRFTETITQATFVESLIPHISSDANLDRDLLLRSKKLKKADSEELQERPFRNLFIDEQDDQMSEIIWNYFDAIKLRWPQAWDSYVQGNILSKTNGFRALMRFLKPVYTSLANPIGEVVATNAFREVFKKVTLRDVEFNTQEFPPGTSGEARLLKRLLRDASLNGQVSAKAVPPVS
jgi:DGQHR domain-containing protein